MTTICTVLVSRICTRKSSLLVKFHVSRRHSLSTELDVYYVEQGRDAQAHERYLSSSHDCEVCLYASNIGFYWEGCPPTEVADLVFHSYPNHVMRLMHTRLTKDIADADRYVQSSSPRLNGAMVYN